MRNKSVWLILTGCLLFLFSSAAQACDPAVQVCAGLSCTKKGTTMMDYNGQNVLACLTTSDTDSALIWKSMTSSSSGDAVHMQAPRAIFSGSGATGWVNVALPDAPAGTKYVMVQYVYEIAYPDGAGNSYIYSRANAASPTYIVTAGRSAGNRDANGGAGQSILPFNTATKTIQFSVNQYFGGWYTLYAVGFI